MTPSNHRHQVRPARPWPEESASDYKGLDVDVARYVAKELGFEGDKVIFKGTPVRPT